MLRITVDHADGVKRVRLEGWFLAEWRAAVLEACTATHHGTRVRIDVSAVLYADRVGVEVLRNLRDSGIEIISGSSYLQTLLKLEQP